MKLVASFEAKIFCDALAVWGCEIHKKGKCRLARELGNKRKITITIPVDHRIPLDALNIQTQQKIVENEKTARENREPALLRCQNPEDINQFFGTTISPSIIHWKYGETSEIILKK